MDLKEKDKKACQLIQEGEAGLALPLVNELIDAKYPAAHFIKGILFMKGGKGVEVDLVRATACFRQEAVIAPGAISYLYMARALMRQEEPARSESLRWLEEAAKAENPPETDLGFGAYYEFAEAPDYVLAKKHYFKAALRGRFAGFAALARVQRAQGQRLAGALTISALWLLSPIYYLIFGSRARNPF